MASLPNVNDVEDSKVDIETGIDRVSGGQCGTTTDGAPEAESNETKEEKTESKTESKTEEKADEKKEEKTTEQLIIPPRSDPRFAPLNLNGPRFPSRERDAETLRGVGNVLNRKSYTMDEVKQQFIHLDICDLRDIFDYMEPILTPQGYRFLLLSFLEAIPGGPLQFDIWKLQSRYGNHITCISINSDRDDDDDDDVEEAD